ncbi:MAG TPA: AMP-binding protein [Vicinamibacterales bacterium]|nr:AMP-binding protein [Vicinamibacterales bacterium]
MDFERRVLAIAAELVNELGGTATTVRLESSLERDLGISSLERVELLLRLERAFHVRLPDAVMANAVTAHDLVNAVVRGGPPVVDLLPSRHEPPSPGTAAPSSAATLVDVLHWHAERTPDRIHIHLREDDKETPLRYGELLVASQRIGAGLRGLGIKRGDTVALMLRTELAFFPVFLGILIVGAVPVPIYPPVRPDQIEEYAHRQRVILRNAGARVLVTFKEALRVAKLLRAAVPSLEHITTIDGLSERATTDPPTRRQSSDPALIQYTSGSTGDPKGVLLSHANILANIRAIGQALAVRPDDVTVSWLPLYHDMGLIGAWLGSLYHGVPLVLMSPLAFLSRPSRWLSAVHTYRGTLSAAPNFAFGLCVHKIADDEIQGLDLRSWRLAMNGSEAVSAETIERFIRRFAPFGFKASAMCPVYGLAESSVALTMSSIDRPARVDALVRGPFERRREIHHADATDAHALRLVSCGRPLPDHQVRIVDGSGQPQGERTEGHVEFRGPSVTTGYFRNPDATRAVMHDGWMDSGDLGYQAEGELFITGRVKDIIIQAGRHICAQEVEEAAATAAGIRKGCTAAFGIHDPALGTERLVVVAETRERDRHRWDTLRTAVQDVVTAAIGVPPDVVMIARPGTVLKTPSGKIRRSAIRDAYQRGTLGRRRPLVVQQVRLAVVDMTARAARLAGALQRFLFTAYVIAVVVPTLVMLWGYLLVCRQGPSADGAVKNWSRVALRLCGLRPTVTGVEHLAGVGAAILAANHASYIDSVVLLATIPTDFRFLAKRRLADYPMIGTVIRKVGHVTIEKATVAQQLSGADVLARLLREGRQMLVFPEGTFLRPAELLPFRLGAFKAAVDTRCPIVPIALRGTRRVLPDGTWLFRRGPIDVIIGAPLLPAAQGWQDMVRLRDEARTVIAHSAGEPMRPA